MKPLNQNELDIMNAIRKAHRNSGGDFTYAHEVICESNLSKNQVKGYLSILQEKSYITICMDEFRQINFCSKSLEIFPDLQNDCVVIFPYVY